MSYVKLTTSNAKVTETQVRWLDAVACAGRTSNWAGSPYSVLDALVRKGLVAVKRRHEDGYRSQWDFYTVTDAGRAVLDELRAAGTLQQMGYR